MHDDTVRGDTQTNDTGLNEPGRPAAEFRQLLHDVQGLRADLVAAEHRQAASIAAALPRHRYSATNLVHYVELRGRDVRELQARLSRHGLTSLGRTEAHVLASIDDLLATLRRLVGHVATTDAPTPDGSAPDGATPDGATPDGAELLRRNAVSLLGPRPQQRDTRIMVTLPGDAATDPGMVRRMLENGMDLARINCAHDGPEAWAAMIGNIRAAEESTGLRCRIAMDLAGPKLRTGPIRPGAEVLKIKPSRTEIGAVRAPGELWLADPGAARPPVPVAPVHPAGWAGGRTVGERIRLVDARGSHRSLTVVEVHDDACLVSTRRTVYLEPGTELTPAPTATTATTAATAPGSPAAGATAVRDPRTPPTARIGTLPAVPRALLVHPGDRIVLTGDLTPATPTRDGVHRIGCTLPTVFDDARVGERVRLDDGKIGGVITTVEAGEITVQVEFAGAHGTKLRAEKGINLPDTLLSVPAITPQDATDLAFVTRHADLVDVSFVRSVTDVADLLRYLGRDAETGTGTDTDTDTDADERATRRSLGVVLKIETVAGFEALPQILLAAMRWDDVGVMIARGDLAVETGFERLAEVQEEILWLCEAAHVPVIWATQVLDTLARTGLPSRAEVTDAAMAERAECVMLNKGPYIDEAISMLAGILVRMQEHTHKKRSLLRRLRSWDLDTVDPR
jgi:pyruvate kinase